MSFDNIKETGGKAERRKHKWKVVPRVLVLESATHWKKYV